MTANKIDKMVFSFLHLRPYLRWMWVLLVVCFVGQCAFPHPFFVYGADFCGLTIAITYDNNDKRVFPILVAMTLFCGITLARWGEPTLHSPEMLHWVIGRIHFVVVFGFVIALWAGLAFPSVWVTKHVTLGVMTSMAILFLATLPVANKLDHSEVLEKVACERIEQGDKGPLCVHPALPKEHAYPLESRLDDALLSFAAGILLTVLLAAREETHKGNDASH